MESFTWEPCFLTGLTRVDEQHRGLVDLINRFGELVVRAGGVSGVQIEKVFADLASYAQEHFREEEELMLQSRIDARHCTAHQQEHARFLQDVLRLHDGGGGAESHDEAARSRDARKLLQFLIDWLAYHILGFDQVMASQIEAVASGMSPAQAFAAVHHERDPATATLLQALDRLFRQMSERNRELFELNRTLEARVAERTRELSETNQRLRDMALTDVLTGLANRRHAMRRLQHEWQDAAGHRQPLACIMLDADGFKPINDQFGHEAGDAVLRQLARRLEAAVRNDDTVCRLGGDEFLVICVNTGLAGALEIAEKLRRAVAASPVPAGAGFWDGSMSIGVAVREAGMASVEDLLKAADGALYAAKRGGRNRVATAGASVDKAR